MRVQLLPTTIFPLSNSRIGQDRKRIIQTDGGLITPTYTIQVYTDRRRGGGGGKNRDHKKLLDCGFFGQIAITEMFGRILQYPTSRLVEWPRYTTLYGWVHTHTHTHTVRSWLVYIYSLAIPWSLKTLNTGCGRRPYVNAVSFSFRHIKTNYRLFEYLYLLLLLLLLLPTTTNH